MSTVFLLIFGICSWFRPVFGFGMYILLMTPIRNVLSPICHTFTWAFLLTPAIIKLLPRKGKPLRAVEICALVFSLVVLIREFDLLPSGFPITKLIYIPLFAGTWVLQLIAFNKLTEKEIANLRIWMCIAGIIVGIWGTLVYLTNNAYLISMGRSNSLIISANLNVGTEKLVANRYIVYGLFGVVPYTYWYVLRGALTPMKHWIWNLIMWCGVIAIFIAVGVSLTRSLMILFVAGTIVMVISGTGILLAVQFFYKRSSRRVRTYTLLTVIVGTCVITAGIHYINLNTIIKPFSNRFSTLSHDDYTVSQRLNQSSIAWNNIKKDGCIFGATDRLSITTVDTAVFLRVWLLYGLLGVITFAAMFFIVFSNLLKSWIKPRFRTEDILFRGMLTAWSLVFVYNIVAGYSLHPEEIFFTMLFFSEVSRLKNVKQKTFTPRSVRVAI